MIIGMRVFFCLYTRYRRFSELLLSPNGIRGVIQKTYGIESYTTYLARIRTLTNICYNNNQMVVFMDVADEPISMHRFNK